MDHRQLDLDDSLIEAVKAITEKDMHPNQEKLDKNKNGKLDKDDFKILRGEKVKEDIELDEAVVYQVKDKFGDVHHTTTNKTSANHYHKELNKIKPSDEYKLYKNGKVVKEDIDDLNELDRNGILKRYISKTNPDYKTQDEIDKRAKGRALALKKKWGDKKYGLEEPKVKAVTREEVELTQEQIDEIEALASKYGINKE